MGNSSGCCSNNSEVVMNKGEKDLTNQNNLNDKNDGIIKVINEIESKSNTNEVTNNINHHNNNNKNLQKSINQNNIDPLIDINKNNNNENKAKSDSQSYNPVKKKKKYPKV